MVQRRVRILLLLFGFYQGTIAQNTWIQQNAAPKLLSDVPAEALQCFELPYGGVGFAVHCIAYYITICFLLGRRPLLPTERLQNRSLLIALCMLSFIFVGVFTSFAISSCSQNWPYALLAAWNFVLSILLSGSGILSSFHMGKNVPKIPASSLVSVFIAGCIMGAIGIFTVTRSIFHDNGIARGLSYALIPTLAAVILIAGGIALSKRFHYREFVSARIVVVVMPSIFLLYSDWILASVQGNWAGIGQDYSRAVYWVDFVALLLPIFAI